MDRGIVFRTKILGVDALEKVFQFAHVQLFDPSVSSNSSVQSQAAIGTGGGNSRNAVPGPASWPPCADADCPIRFLSE
jgi:hypothetical protein